MNYQTLLKLINGKETVKVGKKNNQIYYDKDSEMFVVEMFEFKDNNTDMFSVADSFEDIETAITVAKRYTCDTYNYDVHKRLVG